MPTPAFRILVAAASAKVLIGLTAWCALLWTGAVETRLPSWGGNVSTSAALVLGFSAAAVLLLAGRTRGEEGPWLGLSLLLAATPFADVPGRNTQLLGGVAAFAARVHLEAALPAALWAFARVFPRAPSSVPVVAAADRVSDAWFVVPVVCASLLLDQVNSELVTATYWPLLMLAVVSTLPVLVRRTLAASHSERRRVALFAAGVIGGVLPMAIDIVLRAASDSWRGWVSDPSRNRLMTTVAIVALLMVPITTTYAVLVARVFDFRLVVRRALQYALARTSLVLLVLVPLVILARILYFNRTATIEELVTGPSGVASLTVAALATAALASRSYLVRALDRRFLRSERDAHAVLTALVDACRRAESIDRLAATLVDGVDRALHVEHASCVVRDAAGVRFQAARGRAEPLAVESLLASLLSTSDEPLAVQPESSSSVFDRLDEGSREWLQSTGAELLVPMRDVHGTLVGVLALGPKRSELAYSEPERRLLAMVGTAGGLVIGKFRPAPTPSRPDAVDTELPAHECPVCGRVAEASQVLCECGGPLEESDVPRLLAGKYEISARLGRGGMGVVYRANDSALRRQVAVKTLPRADSTQFHRLRREAQAMAQVTHPALAGIYGLETWQRRPFLIVELLERGTLADRLQAGPLDRGEVLSIVSAVAKGLAALHAAGLLHRDIKPSNIGFTARGEAKLLDFGLARPVDTTHGQALTFRTETGVVAGTPSYMPPEAFDGAEPSVAFDLWALSVVTLESLMGQNPFQGEHFGDTYSRVRSADAARPWQHLDGLAPFFDAAFCRDPARRPSSAKAWLHSLAVSGV